MICFIDKKAPNYDDWKDVYGICSECGLDVVLVDRETWMDDMCHRHKFDVSGRV